MTRQRPNLLTIQHRLKGVVACGCVLTGVAALARRQHEQRLRILMYHGVLPRCEGPAAYGDLFMTEQAFARHMRHLKQAFHVMSLEDVLHLIEAQSAFPDRAVLITFDDGYRNTITTALPVLRALRLPASVFLPAQLVGTTALLWFDVVRVLVAACVATRRMVDVGGGVVINGCTVEDPATIFADCVRQIRGLARAEHDSMVRRLQAISHAERFAARHPEFALAGWEEWRQAALDDGMISIGSHGCSHGELVRFLPEEQLSDLQQSKRLIEHELCRPCRAVAYPFGAWNLQVADAARQAGYACGLTTDDGLSHVVSDPWTLRRTMVGDRGNFWVFHARVSGIWEQLRVVTGRRQDLSRPVTSRTRWWDSHYASRV